MRTLVLLLLTVPLVAGCDLIDLGGSGDGETANLPPGIEWTATTPEDLEFAHDRSTGSPIQFSVMDAVWDPDNDPLYFVWYGQTPNGDIEPLPGERMMSLVVCDSLSLRAASEVMVTVAVSDEQIGYDSDAAPEPILPAGADVVSRTWTVYLFGECP
jgi:hypothetical protein